MPTASAQGRPVRVICPWPPGAANDALARLFAQQLQDKLFQTVAIPFYAVLDSSQNVVASSPGLTKDPQEFLRFLPRGAPPFALASRSELWSYDGVPDSDHLPDDYARKLKHGYYAAVSYTDAQIGKVLDRERSTRSAA